ncbi:MAG: ATP-binding protein [Candidatus Aminicenantes bacterium]|jgi:DNA helicase HerA-like ATPase
MSDSIGKVLGNANLDSFQFASNKYFDAKFICVPTNQGKYTYKILGEVTKIQVINPYFEKPADIRYIADDDEGVRARSIYVAHVIALGTLIDDKIIDHPFPPIPGSNVFNAEETDIKLSLRLPDDGIDIGILKDHKFELKIPYEKLVRTHNSIVGQTGSGKSYLAAKLAVELLKKRKTADVPRRYAIPIIFDTSGEYSGDSHIKTNHNEIARVLDRLSIDDLRFPLLNKRYLWLLSEIYDLDDKIVILLQKWFKAQENQNTGSKNNNPDRTLFEAEEDKRNNMTRELIREFSLLKIVTTEQLADKIEEYLLQFNELNPKKKLTIPYKALLNMRKFNLKVKKTDDWDLLDRLSSGLIIDLSDQNDLTLKQILMKLILSQLLEAAKFQKLKHKIAIFIDEAHNYVPSIYKSLCKDEILTIAREGRKYDITLFLVSQRPRWVDPTALSQCGNIFIFRIQNSEDQRHIFDSSSLPDSVRDLNIARLGTGKMIVVGDVTENPIICDVSEIDKDFISAESERIRSKVMNRIKKSVYQKNQLVK